MIDYTLAKQLERQVDILLYNKKLFGEQHTKFGEIMFKMKSQEGIPIRFIQSHIRKEGHSENFIRAATLAFYEKEMEDKIKNHKWDFDNLTKTQTGLQKKNRKRVIELYEGVDLNIEIISKH